MRIRMTSRTAAVITTSETFIFFSPLFSRSIALTPDSVLIDMCSDKKIRLAQHLPRKPKIGQKSIVRLWIRRDFDRRLGLSRRF